MGKEEVYPEQFSKFYSQFMGTFAARVAPQIHELYSKENIFKKEKTLLDICCGPGDLAYYFLEKGFSIIGIDLSDTMLEVASRKKSSYDENSKWIKADASHFSLNKKFGLIVSTFNSVNLLRDLRELESCFRCAHAHLHRNGVFIFDINTKAGIAASNNISVTEAEDFTIIAKGHFDGRSDRGFLRFSGFMKARDNLFEKFEHCSSNTVFTVSDVTKLLLQSGFEDIRYYIFGISRMERVDDPESHTQVAIYARHT